MGIDELRGLLKEHAAHLGVRVKVSKPIACSFCGNEQAMSCAGVIERWDAWCDEDAEGAHVLDDADRAERYFDLGADLVAEVRRLREATDQARRVIAERDKLKAELDSLREALKQIAEAANWWRGD